MRADSKKGEMRLVDADVRLIVVKDGETALQSWMMQH